MEQNLLITVDNGIAVKDLVEVARDTAEVIDNRSPSS